MKHFRMVPLAVLLMVLVAFSTANGQAAKFHSVGSAVNSQGGLVVSWDERGLGEGDVNYTLSAGATATFGCVNRGENHPEAANKETVNAEVSANGSFDPTNGRIVASLTAGPPSAGTFSCPRGQRLVLASVSYTNCVLTDTTNGSSTSCPDASSTFFTFQ